MSKRVVCCIHNRCPDRPTWFLWRFRNRPWYCEQCGRLWTTYNALNAYGDSFYKWSCAYIPPEKKSKQD